MGPNPFLGVLLHAIGGLAAASFYIPYKSVRGWSWETFWLVGGFFSWIVAPWLVAGLTAPDLPGILRSAPPSALFWAWFFGVLWGVGGLTFGLSMRYLGISLGYAIALGLCAAFGTLVPPIVKGELGVIASATGGQIVLLGVAVCLAGIALSGIAGRRKEAEMPADAREGSAAEFSLVKGLAVATFSGIMSASMSYGLQAGKPIAATALSRGCPELWQNTPVFVVILLGGFMTNLVWCAALNIRHRTGSQYLAREHPRLANYLLCIVGGTTWYLQFMFYGMGTTKMGRFDFSSWTLHMSAIIIFSTLWGLALKEWLGTSRRTHALIALGLLVLIGSTLIVGYGNYLVAP